MEEKDEIFTLDFLKVKYASAIEVIDKLQHVNAKTRLKAAIWFFLFCVSLAVNIGFLIF